MDLISALESESGSNINRILDMNPDINFKNNIGTTPLMFALTNKNGNVPEEIVSRMLDMGANVNDKNDEGVTPLLFALTSRNSVSEKVLLRILDMKPDVNSNFKGIPVLLYAIHPGNKNINITEKVILRMLDLGPDVNIKDIHGLTPLMLMLASVKGNVTETVVSRLLDMGADVYAKDNKGRAPLTFAKKNGRWSKNILDKLRPGFRLTANQVIQLIKMNDLYKWQSICKELGNKRLTELRDLAKLEDIETNGKSKRQLCSELAQKMENEMKQEIGVCENLTSILGDDVSSILGPLLFKVKEGKKTFCFNILELNELIDSGKTKNPFTNQPLPIESIRFQMAQLSKKLVKEKMAMVDILQQIRDAPIFNKEQIQKQTLRDIFAKLNYPGDLNVFYKSLESEIKRRGLIESLQQTGIRIQTNLSKDQIILEMARIVTIDDSHRLALEVAINEIGSPMDIDI
jgi:hypothetical protein